MIAELKPGDKLIAIFNNTDPGVNPDFWVRVGDILTFVGYAFTSSGTFTIPLCINAQNKLVADERILLCPFLQDMNTQIKVPVCECGSDKIGHSRHSDWCPKGE